MNEFNKQLYGLGIQKTIQIYLKHYFDIHGEILPSDGLHPRFMNEIERALIEETLKRMGGNQIQSAKLLGINRNTLRQKIKNLNISLENL